MSTRILTSDDDDYPAGMALVELTGGAWARPAPKLYLRGELPSSPGVAIVGSRDAAPRAQRFARRLARAVARQGWAVWSGGARGVDRAAHEGALAEKDGRTVLVNGGGLDHPYPPENATLHAQILKSQGALLSVHSDEVESFRWTFPKRNVVLVALTQATVVVAAADKGGTMVAARQAMNAARPVFVLPDTPIRKETRGATMLLQRGARPILNVEDAIERLGKVVAPPLTLFPLGETPPPRSRRAPEPPAPRAAPLLERSEDASLIHAEIDDEPRTVDDLCARTGLSAARVNGALLILKLRGEVWDAGGRFRRAW